MAGTLIAAPPTSIICIVRGHFFIRSLAAGSTKGYVTPNADAILVTGVMI